MCLISVKFHLFIAKHEFICNFLRKTPLQLQINLQTLKIPLGANSSIFEDVFENFGEKLTQ